MKKKVLLVTHDTSASGAPTVALAIVKEFAKKGYHVEVVSLDPGELLPQFKEAAQKVFNFEHEHIIRHHHHKRRFVRLTRDYRINKLKKRVERGHYDIVFFNSAASLKFDKLLPRHQRTKRVLYLHERGYIIKSLFPDLTPFKERADLFDEIYTVSKSNHELYIQEGLINENKLYIHYPYIGKPTPPALPTIEDEKGGTPKVLKIGALGSVSWVKGIDIFIELAKKLKDEKRIEFLWAGGHEGSEDFRRANWTIDKHQLRNIKMLGHLDNPQEYLTTLSILPLLSREDSCPLVIQEALNRGVIPIAFRGCGGAEEIISQISPELLFDFNDLEAIENFLNEILDNHQKLDAFIRKIKTTKIILNNTGSLI